MGQNTQRSKRVEGKTKEAHRNTETCMVFKNSYLLYIKNLKSGRQILNSMGL